MWSMLRGVAGARRGILGLPGVREDVGIIGIHHNGQFIEIVPSGGLLKWDVSPWGRYGFHTNAHSQLQACEARV